MKNLFIISGLIIILLTSCRLTNPSGTIVNEAMLVIENYTSNTYYMTIEDGSLGPYEENIIFSGQTFTQTWEADDELFVLNDGLLLLRFHAENQAEEIAYQQMVAGYTNYFSLSSSNSFLEIRNDTSSDAWYTIDSGDPGFLFSGETDVISFGEIGFSTDVDLFYTGYHVFSNYTQITMYPSTTEEFEIQPDAGAIKLENTSLSDITEVYIASQDDPYWGENLLNSLLEPGESAFWTVEPGWWDIRIIDEWDAAEDFLGNYIILDETEIITFRSVSGNERKVISEIKQISDDSYTRSRKLEPKTFNH